MTNFTTGVWSHHEDRQELREALDNELHLAEVIKKHTSQTPTEQTDRVEALFDFTEDYYPI